MDLLEVKLFAWESINEKDWSLFSWYGEFEITGDNAKILNVNPFVDYNNDLFSAEINNEKNTIKNLGTKIKKIEKIVSLDYLVITSSRNIKSIK